MLLQQSVVDVFVPLACLLNSLPSIQLPFTEQIIIAVDGVFFERSVDTIQ